jgi:murein peptide amidase A
MPAAKIETVKPGHHRAIADVLAPLNELAARSCSLIAAEGGKFEIGRQSCELSRYLFIGPKGGGDTIRLGLFAGIHGDKPEGVHALIRFVQLLEAEPQLATGYCLFIYPICNPTGFEDRTWQSRSGKDLNREFWRNSPEPEVKLLQSELVAHAFDGIISLHTDDTSQGFYGYAHGATLTRHLIEPALVAAAEFLPRNVEPVIDGFAARNGVIRHRHPGALSAPAKSCPRPFEIVLETPSAPPTFFKEAALVAALRAILIQYREFIAYAHDL